MSDIVVKVGNIYIIKAIRLERTLKVLISDLTSTSIAFENMDEGGTERTTRIKFNTYWKVVEVVGPAAGTEIGHLFSPNLN